MNINKASPLTFGRRKFILAAIMSPFILSILKTDIQNGEAILSNSLKNEGFILIDGWVLLKEDFNDDIGDNL